MEKNISKDFLDFKEKYKDFNNSFSEFQRNSRLIKNYYDFEAYKDLKICFTLYFEIYDSLGHHQLDISPNKLKKIIGKFNCLEKRELICFFIRKLDEKGNIEGKHQFSSLLTHQEIVCLWEKIRNGKSIFYNSLLLIFKISSYNIFTLLISLVSIFFLLSLVFLPAPFTWMEILIVERVYISNNFILNHLANTLLYFFDIGDHMKVAPLNFFAVLTLISLKILIILVIGNYLFKEIIRKIKLP